MIYKIYYTFLGSEHFIYVKARTPESALIEAHNNLTSDTKITCIYAVEEHQISGQYDVCLNFENPVAQRELLFG